jgi:hypothetical protein
VTLPVDKQGRRVFHGMMPVYYHRVDFSYPSPEVIVLTFWHFDYQFQVDAITSIIQLNYTSALQDTLASVIRTFPVDGPPV